MILVGAPMGATTMATAAVTEDGPSEFYEDGLIRFNKGDYLGAIIQLKNALQENPDNPPARLLMGIAYLRTGQGALAEIQIKRARSAGTDDSLTLVPLAEAYLQQRKYVEFFAEIVTRGVDRELDAQVLVMRGRAHLERREIKKAEADYERAGQLRPNYAPVILGRAKILLLYGNFEQAGELVDKAIKLDPESSNVWHMKGEVGRLKHQSKSALQYYNKAIALEEGHLQARLARAALLIELDRHEEAKADLELVRAVLPNDNKAVFLTALIMTKNNEVEAAQALLEKASTSIETTDPQFMNNASGLLLSGFISYSRKDFEKAYTYLHRYIGLVPHHPGARKLIGAILLRWDDPAGAIDYLRPALRSSIADPQLMALIGNAYMRTRQFNKATEMFARAAEIAPDRAAIRMQLALGRLATGKRAEGLEDLEIALTLDAGKSKVSATLGMIHLKARNYGKALKIAEALLIRDAANPIAYNLAGAALAGISDFAGARASFNRAIAIDPDFTPAQSNLAELNRMEKKQGAEKTLYENIVEREPSNTLAMVRLSRIAQKDGRREDATKWLEKARVIDPRLLKPQLALIGIYLANRQTPKAFEVALDLASRYPENVNVLEALGRVELSAVQASNAAVTFRKIVKLVEKSPKGLYLASKLLMSAKAFEDARLALQAAIDLKPDYLPAQIAMADLDARQGRIDEALQRAAVLRDSRPKSAIGDIVAGDVLMRSKRPEEAIKAYEAAFKKAQTTLTVTRLFKARREVFGTAGGLSPLAKWVETRPDDITSRRLLASAYGHVGKTQIAIRHFEHILEKIPNDATVLNNLALLYQETSDPRGLSFAERAQKLAPKHPATLDTLGWVLVQRGDMSRGLKFLRMAYNRASREPEIQYHLGVALSRLGRHAEAKKQLKSALKTKRKFNGSDAAQDLLNKLSDRLSQPAK